MALTRPRIGQFDTSSTTFNDPITVLHGGATTANLDVGFLMNRANGLVSNVALYWNETGNTFVTAFTSNTGTTDTNIAVTSYANITTGHQLPGTTVTYDIGSPTQRFRSLYLSGNTIDLGGAVIKSDAVTGAIALIPQATATNPNPSGIVISTSGTVSAIQTVAGVVTSANIGNVANTATVSSTSTFANANISGNLVVGGNLTVAGTVTFTNSVIETSTETVLGVEIVAGNLIANAGTTSTSTTTGALVVAGGAGVSGNLNVGGTLTVGSFSATNVYLDRGQDFNDWNTVTIMGTYLINRTSWSGTSNTPLNSQNFTGVLEVLNTGNIALTQNYRPYDNSGSPSVSWTRSKFSTNSWTGWVEMLDGSEAMDGGNF
jgi:hypothetical protein